MNPDATLLYQIMIFSSAFDLINFILIRHLSSGISAFEFVKQLVMVIKRIYVLGKKSRPALCGC